ncbi:unnamed protein product [Penicillium nalgiovense]|nr:unnamed protein product [Penicillium nalgiovense]
MFKICGTVVAVRMSQFDASKVKRFVLYNSFMPKLFRKLCYGAFCRYIISVRDSVTFKRAPREP